MRSEVTERPGNRLEIAALPNRLRERAIAPIDVSSDGKHLVIPIRRHDDDSSGIGDNEVARADADAAARNGAVDLERADAPFARERRDVAAAHAQASRLDFVYVAAAAVDEHAG